MIDTKMFLDFAGLSQYDELIKAYIDSQNANDQGGLTQVIADLAAVSAKVDANEANIATNAGDIATNAAAIAVLNGDGEGSVSKSVADAIAALVDSAPETFDTLKEIADWIANDETGTAALIARVDEAEDAIEALQAANEDIKEYVDAQDSAYYNAIQSIENVKIASLFPVKQAADESAASAIASLEEGKGLELTANQTIADNIVIDKACYIDANGSTFTGTVTVPADKEVIIENAKFSNPVVVA